jgi:predicted dinucleotide-binding enzyme
MPNPSVGKPIIKCCAGLQLHPYAFKENTMNITIIGTGNMARGIATRTLAGGHTVTLIGQEAGKAETLATELQGTAQAGASIRAASSGAAIDGDNVVLAVPYASAAPIVQQYGDQLVGKVIVDITNPVDFSTMSPSIAAGTSGAEEIAKATPVGAKVVKAFNTTFAGTLLAGQVANQRLDVFIAGDDADAKATISQLVSSGGLRPIDAGPLQRARQLVALGLLHMIVQFTLNTGFGSAVKIII